MKALSRITLLTVLLLGGLAACTNSPAAQEPDRAALEAAIHRWMAAVNAGDAATLTSTMTPDVELVDDATTASGRDSAIRSLGETVTRGKLIATTREITITGDVAWHVVGLAQIQPNGPVHARGHALEIWRRVNGEWKLHRRMAAGAASPEVSLTRPSTKEPVLDRPKE